MKSKYDKYISQIKEIVDKEPSIGSETIATEIVKANPDDKIKWGSLARFIRRLDLQKKETKIEDVVKNKYAKVLVFDIETAPILAFTWTLYPNAIGTDMVKRDWFMFSWSGKWLFDDSIMSHVLTPKEAKEGNDKRIVKALWDVLNEADIVIAHNGDKFDVRKSNACFLKHGLNLPSPYQTIDTLKVARRKFALTSSRLDFIAKQVIGIDGKMETEKGLWWRCYDGDADALEKMRSYCDKDVFILEDVYLALRPYIQPHPNIGLLEDGVACLCPACGSDKLTVVGTPYRTYVNEFETLRCDDCQSLSRQRKNSTPLAVKQRMLVSLPR